MDLLNEKKTYPQKVEVVNSISLNMSDDSMVVDFDPTSNFTTGTRLKVAQEDPNLHGSCLAGNTIADGKINVTIDNIVCRWVDSNNLFYHQIYPVAFTMYNVSDVNDGINLNSVLGAYKGMIESIVQTGTTYSVTLNYHTCNYARHLSWLSYGQTWTKP